MIKKQTTRDLLAMSVHELAERQPLDKISVKDICQNCGITTQTFYNHFQDKLDLIAWVLTRETEDIYTGYAEGKYSWKEATHTMVQRIYNDRAFCRNAFTNTSGQNSFITSTHSHSIELLTEIVRRKAGEDFSRELEFFVSFYLRGTSISILEWIKEGCRISPEQLAEYFLKAIPEPLTPYLV